MSLGSVFDIQLETRMLPGTVHCSVKPVAHTSARKKYVHPSAHACLKSHIITHYGTPRTHISRHACGTRCGMQRRKHLHEACVNMDTKAEAPQLPTKRCERMHVPVDRPGMRLEGERLQLAQLGQAAELRWRRHLRGIECWRHSYSQSPTVGVSPCTFIINFHSCS